MRNPHCRSQVVRIVLALCLVTAAGCSTASMRGVPADFRFVMDAGSAASATGQNVNIRIDARGQGRYEVYDTGGSIEFDEDNMVVYKRAQVVKAGRFKLQEQELRQLWELVIKQNFFALTGDYRMEIGSAFAFVMVEAEGRRHQV